MVWSVVIVGSLIMLPYAVVAPYETRLSDAWSVVRAMAAEPVIIFPAATALKIGGVFVLIVLNVLSGDDDVSS